MTEIEYQQEAGQRPASLIEVEDADPLRNLELAAARAEVRVLHLLRTAFERSSLSQKELAEHVGVTEGRVSQVLNSEGNLKITTIARFLRALGYKFELDATPTKPNIPSLTPRREKRKSRRKNGGAVYYANERGSHKILFTSRKEDHEPARGNFYFIGDLPATAMRETANAIDSNITFRLQRGQQESPSIGKK